MQFRKSVTLLLSGDLHTNKEPMSSATSYVQRLQHSVLKALFIPGVSKKMPDSEIILLGAFRDCFLLITVFVSSYGTNLDLKF